jgi:hypothetical protein
VNCISLREFDELFSKNKAKIFTDCFNSVKGDIQGAFILKDERGKYALTARQLEHLVNIDEPHSDDWTPYFVGEETNEIRDYLKEQGITLI